MTLRDLKDAIAVERERAIKEARADFPCIKSRGTFIATCKANGDQCSPCPEAEAYEWSGTIKELNALVARVQADHPEVGEVYVAGGYDGAENLRDLLECGDYAPWVSAWHVTFWKREAA